MNKRTVGTAYEVKASEYLKQNGYKILANNYRCPLGEIDLIAKEQRYLVFIEVKYRFSTKNGTGFDAVNYKKQNRIKKAARWYLMEKRIPEDTPCRFDVISFQKDEIRLIQNAFEM